MNVRLWFFVVVLPAEMSDAPATAPPPEVDLASQFEKEKNDPSMIAYLKQLGIDPNYVPPKDDPRRVVINEFAVVFKEHPPYVLKFNKPEDLLEAKKKPIVVKEGAEFKIRVSFRVQHNVVLGLKICNSVSKLGKTLAKDEEMLGTYPPKNEFQMLEIPRLDWTEAPTGMMLRGDYKAKVKVCLSLATHTMLSSHTSFSPCFYLLFCFLYSLLTTTTALTLSSSTSSRSRRTGPSKEVTSPSFLLPISSHLSFIIQCRSVSRRNDTASLFSHPLFSSFFPSSIHFFPIRFFLFSFITSLLVAYTFG